MPIAIFIFPLVTLDSLCWKIEDKHLFPTDAFLYLASTDAALGFQGPIKFYFIHSYLGRYFTEKTSSPLFKTFISLLFQQNSSWSFLSITGEFCQALILKASQDISESIELKPSFKMFAWEVVRDYHSGIYHTGKYFNQYKR